MAPRPYCPPAYKMFTLVIEPLGILYKDRKYRPYLLQFMEWAAVSRVDIIMWTWEMPYAPDIVEVEDRIG